MVKSAGSSCGSLDIGAKQLRPTLWSEEDLSDVIFHTGDIRETGSNLPHSQRLAGLASEQGTNGSVGILEPFKNHTVLTRLNVKISLNQITLNIQVLAVLIP